MNLCGRLQVLQDMGLPTGVELKTADPVKSEEAVVAASVEEMRPVVTPVETSAATGAANADATDAVEVQTCSVCVMMMSPLLFCSNFTDDMLFISDCSPTRTNPD